jgi:diaminopimelate epimerase
MIPFYKYHGLGNDFVLIDAVEKPIKMDAQTAQRLCDRHTGVGADGILMVLPSKKAPFRMRIYNADGSEAQMCGNGLRCFARHLIDHRLAKGPRLEVETGRGVLACEVFRKKNGTIESVKVEMGRAVFERSRLPMMGSGEFIQGEIECRGRKVKGTAVSMGNPHLVVFGSADRMLAAELGPLLERHEFFPERINVGFAKILGRKKIDLIVHERGCGITLACGTGACAAVAAAARLGWVDFDREIEVSLPGGSLWIQVPVDFTGVSMRGPAELLFKGEWQANP